LTTSSRGDTAATNALIVPLRECTPWCEKGDGHPDEFPHDRRCWSSYGRVPLSVAGGHHKFVGTVDDTWVLPHLNVYLSRDYDLEDPQVVIHSEDADAELYLSLDAARSLRDKLDGLLGIA